MICEGGVVRGEGVRCEGGGCVVRVEGVSCEGGNYDM